ncbi:hypothetical protein DEU56DRAFT_767400 [Suillus clintonianus]|uniref:uncharacterized protein n=1 Tax=Suillus clintonianus TaxID=1904413 RepID=UPI001B8604DE|nr:uncharacterized protein DEU56DRAFT_767400 [Suillus clintonianus]KAG2155443.1 hypothetical protein DEU56DRAFT_767400 [Suillus clintonianus]
MLVYAAFEMTILLLTGCQAFHHKQITNSPLAARLHCNDIFHVMCILCKNPLPVISIVDRGNDVVMSLLNIMVLSALVSVYSGFIDT